MLASKSENSALEVLKEISNQDTRYNWCRVTRQKNQSDFIRRKPPLGKVSSPLKLPPLGSRENAESVLSRFRSRKKKKQSCIQSFFRN